MSFTKHIGHFVAPPKHVTVAMTLWTANNAEQDPGLSISIKGLAGPLDWPAVRCGAGYMSYLGAGNSREINSLKVMLQWASKIYNCQYRDIFTCGVSSMNCQFIFILFMFMLLFASPIELETKSCVLCNTLK